MNTELHELEAERDRLKHDLDHKTYWYKEEVQRDCRRLVEIEHQIKLLSERVAE